ncbi:MAG: hypothetical protein HFF36_07830 [Coprobacillus sp.]|nr:hypothetical protein [Coprobacillus sp.]
MKLRAGYEVIKEEIELSMDLENFIKKFCEDNAENFASLVAKLSDEVIIEEQEYKLENNELS